MFSQYYFFIPIWIINSQLKDLKFGECSPSNVLSEFVLLIGYLFLLHHKTDKDLRMCWPISNIFWGIFPNTMVFWGFFFVLSLRNISLSFVLLTSKTLLNIDKVVASPNCMLNLTFLLTEWFFTSSWWFHQILF